MFFSCGSESGVSLGTTTSFLRSLRCTSAARWIRFSPIEWAMAESVLPEHGQITIAAVRKEPLAIGVIRFL